jgi:hypothetical protein
LLFSTEAVKNIDDPVGSVRRDDGHGHAGEVDGARRRRRKVGRRDDLLDLTDDRGDVETGDDRVSDVLGQGRPRGDQVAWRGVRDLPGCAGIGHVQLLE